MYIYRIELQPYIVKFSKQENKLSTEFSFIDLLIILFVTSFVSLGKFSSEQVCETTDSLCTL